MQITSNKQLNHNSLEHTNKSGEYTIWLHYIIQHLFKSFIDDVLISSIQYLECVY